MHFVTYWIVPEKYVEAEQSHNLLTMSKERECFKQVTNLSESVPSVGYRIVFGFLILLK